MAEYIDRDHYCKYICRCNGDKKEMNDNDIIKLMKVCSTASGCSSCPLAESTDCADEVYSLALDIIKRQKAEIERLLAYNAIRGAANSYIANTLLDEVSKARAKAIKEFADRLKQTRVDLGGIEMVAVGNIDTIAEEMTEE